MASIFNLCVVKVEFSWRVFLRLNTHFAMINPVLLFSGRMSHTNLGNIFSFSLSLFISHPQVYSFYSLSFTKNAEFSLDIHFVSFSLSLYVSLSLSLCVSLTLLLSHCILSISCSFSFCFPLLTVSHFHTHTSVPFDL